VTLTFSQEHVDFLANSPSCRLIREECFHGRISFEEALSYARMIYNREHHTSQQSEHTGGDAPDSTHFIHISRKTQDLPPVFQGLQGFRRACNALQKVLPLSLWRVWLTCVLFSGLDEDPYLGTAALSDYTGLSQRAIQLYLQVMLRLDLLSYYVGPETKREGKHVKCVNVRHENFKKAYALAYQYLEWTKDPEYVPPSWEYVDYIKRHEHIRSRVERFENYRRILNGKRPGRKPKEPQNITIVCRNPHCRACYESEEEAAQYLPPDTLKKPAPKPQEVDDLTILAREMEQIDRELKNKERGKKVARLPENVRTVKKALLEQKDAAENQEADIVFTDSRDIIAATMLNKLQEPQEKEDPAITQFFLNIIAPYRNSNQEFNSSTIHSNVDVEGEDLLEDNSEATEQPSFQQTNNHPGEVTQQTTSPSTPSQPSQTKRVVGGKAKRNSKAKQKGTVDYKKFGEPESLDKSALEAVYHAIRHNAKAQASSVKLPTAIYRFGEDISAQFRDTQQRSTVSYFRNLLSGVLECARFLKIDVETVYTWYYDAMQHIREKALRASIYAQADGKPHRMPWFNRVFANHIWLSVRRALKLGHLPPHEDVDAEPHNSPMPEPVELHEPVPEDRVVESTFEAVEQPDEEFDDQANEQQGDIPSKQTEEQPAEGANEQAESAADEQADDVVDEQPEDVVEELSDEQPEDIADEQADNVVDEQLEDVADEQAEDAADEQPFEDEAVRESTLVALRGLRDTDEFVLLSPFFETVNSLQYAWTYAVASGEIDMLYEQPEAEAEDVVSYYDASETACVVPEFPRVQRIEPKEHFRNPVQFSRYLAQNGAYSAIPLKEPCPDCGCPIGYVAEGLRPVYICGRCYPNVMWTNRARGELEEYMAYLVELELRSEDPYA
jgi:hypothetical protein